MTNFNYFSKILVYLLIIILKINILQLKKGCTEEGGKTGVAGDCNKYTECFNGQLFNRTCNDIEQPNFDVVSKECGEVAVAQCYVGMRILIEKNTYSIDMHHSL